MRHYQRSMKGEPLNDRQKLALRWLAAQEKEVYAFQLADHFRREGVFKTEYRRDGEVNSAANSLVALRRRGLADHGGTHGVFVQAKWHATDEGRRLIEEMDHAG